MLLCRALVCLSIAALGATRLTAQQAVSPAWEAPLLVISVNPATATGPAPPSPAWMVPSAPGTMPPPKYARLRRADAPPYVRMF